MQGFLPWPFFFISFQGAKHINSRGQKIETCLRGRVWGNKCVTYLLFVNHILMLSNDSLGEDKKYQELLQLYCKAFAMKVNYNKSTIYFIDPWV